MEIYIFQGVLAEDAEQMEYPNIHKDTVTASGGAYQQVEIFPAIYVP